ncbi:replicase [Clostridium estertheticum]|uniref:Replicase n=1 Tax=Clostridium estertheticum TaxID=238834 RepID=A0A5N7IQ57_9CLOT|nr:replicase [Clostridium estertheticum]MPQ32455.1 replicase [Clostridium estertheticum]MPQ63114.1 replicase [Clostridium estertheticum]
MKIIRVNRGNGKTTELVKKSNKEWQYIICKDEQRVQIIMETAKWLKLDIPFPIIIKELPLRSIHIESVLVDDLDDVLESIIGKRIDYATTSCEIEG